MNLTSAHIDILKHTRDRAAGGFYCGDSPEMQELVAGGYMAYAGRKSFVPDPYFRLTGKGMAALAGRASATKAMDASRPGPALRGRTRLVEADEPDL
jgi:hypothetical protein